MTPPTRRQHALAYLAALCNISILIAFVALLPWGVIAIWCAAIAVLFGLRFGIDLLSRSIGSLTLNNRSHEDVSA